MMEHRKCENCQRLLKPNNQWILCESCDESLEAHRLSELTFEEQKWALAHKCRKCSAGLPLSRYFECYKCNNPYLVETESEFDTCDEQGWEYA